MVTALTDAQLSQCDNGRWPAKPERRLQEDSRRKQRPSTL
jgi:hypothetical protein